MLGVEYFLHGACKLMQCLGFAFTELYNRIVNGLRPKESVVFADAARPEYQSRPPALGWFQKGSNPIPEASTERRRLNACGAFNLEEMRLSRVESERVGSDGTRRL